MATAGLLALIDDISTVLDDVAILTKIAAKKTSGVLGDDLALNAQQVSGVKADRELPVVWAVAKGSFLNKLILVPAALLLSVFLPWIITPLLILGGLFLCYEGFEKILHAVMHRNSGEKGVESALAEINRMGESAYEQKKIKGAIRTDFILSAEIVVISLGIVQSASLTQQILVLSTIALAMTVGVYGLVAAIVKLDDLGIYLSKQVQSKIVHHLGNGILGFCPYLMKLLSIVGTLAMFLVGGGIVVHGWSWLHHVYLSIEKTTQTLPHTLIELLFNGTIGLLAGALVFLGVLILSKFKPAKS